jgi:DEAD/DEAH box helicase
MINFDILGGGSGGDTPITDPRKLFTTLPRSPKFSRPSDVQGEVLDHWFSRRTSRNLTLKMNTGSGKTVVGLLVLQSSLNEGVGTAVYITPNKFLTAQVISEAKDLGINTTEDEDDHLFLRGEAILVANIFKVINGGSHFGVNKVSIPIGAAVIDDAHACFSVIESQFTIEISREHSAYREVWALFSDQMKAYDQFRHHDIGIGDPSALVEVPFWMWQSQVGQVREILKRHGETEADIKFPLRLIDNVLPLCQCVFGGRRMAFAPRCTPIGVIPAFAQAKRKVFMTATLANDGVLVTHLGADRESMTSPITPSTSDMGDRLIITPQEINRAYSEEELRDIARTVAQERNVVVLVPSKFRSEFWAPVAAQVLESGNMEAGVAALRTKHVGLTVLVNRYDGIDLPGTACELLIMDGLPRSIGPLRERRNDVLEGSKGLVIEQVQRVEQGMGRGVRSGDDRCVVVLFGSDLTKVVNFPETFDRFTPTTQAQIKLARQIATQIASTAKQELLNVMAYSFGADPSWLKASKVAIVNAPKADQSYFEEYVEAERAAFDYACIQQYEKAADTLKPLADGARDPLVKGYLKQQQAEYTNFFDKPTAQAILITAVASNSAVVKPIAGVQHARIKAHNEQAMAAADFLQRFTTPHQMLIWAMELRDRLVFDPDRTDDFEKAIQEVGQSLGFQSARPEKETGKGPDNLWALAPNSLAVVECKSGALGNEIAKKDCDQLHGSASWCDTQYPNVSRIPIIIHKTNKFGDQAFPAHDFRVVDAVKLTDLKTALSAYFEAVGTGENWRDKQRVGTQLLAQKLTGSMFVSAFTRPAEKP